MEHPCSRCCCCWHCCSGKAWPLPTKRLPGYSGGEMCGNVVVKATRQKAGRWAVLCSAPVGGLRSLPRGCWLPGLAGWRGRGRRGTLAPPWPLGSVQVHNRYDGIGGGAATVPVSRDLEARGVGGGQGSGSYIYRQSGDKAAAASAGSMCWCSHCSQQGTKRLGALSHLDVAVVTPVGTPAAGVTGSSSGWHGGGVRERAVPMQRPAASCASRRRDAGPEADSCHSAQCLQLNAASSQTINTKTLPPTPQCPNHPPHSPT